jgi:hypothetical protein
MAERAAKAIARADVERSDPAESPGHTSFRGGAVGHANNEAAFRHFLEIERHRAERSGRSILLVLVSKRAAPGRNATLVTTTAAAVFSALGTSVRDVDFIGWLREGRVAAAALTQRSAPTPELCEQVASRVISTLRAELRGADRLLRVRVVRLGGKAGF